MGISWTPETHETLLVAMLSTGAAVNAKAIRDAWPAHKGPPPSLSALQQHIAGLKKKVGAGSGTTKSASATPSSRTKTAANSTFSGTPKSRGRPAKHTLFFGSAARATRLVNDSDDSEGEEGEACASTASPTPGTGQKSSMKGTVLGKRDRKQEDQQESGDVSLDGRKPNTFIEQLKAAASQAKGKVKQEPVESTESVQKKAKMEGMF